MLHKQELFFPVDKGGTTLGVKDEGEGPVVYWASGHSGNTYTYTKLNVDPACLEQLATLFSEAAKHQYTPTQEHATASGFFEPPLDLSKPVQDAITVTKPKRQSKKKAVA